MTVIHFIFSIDQAGGGTTTYIQLLASEMKNSCNLIIATGISENPVSIPGVRIEYFDTSLKQLSKLQKSFKSFIESVQPDIVHINGIWLPQNWFFQKVAQELGVQTILSPHGMLEPYIMNRNPWKKRIALALYQNKAIKSANYIHATAQSELDNIRNLGFDNPAKVVANGIDISEVSEKKWGEFETVTNLLFLSRVHPKKGIDILIEAVSRLKRYNLCIKIVGEGEKAYIEELKQKTINYCVEKQFEFAGGIYGNDKWSAIANADLFVLPTHSENFGIVVAEALASRVPVITTTGTPWEELNLHSCGWWIDLSVDSLVDALEKAISLPKSELIEMGSNGRKLVVSKYSIKAVSKEMMEFYKMIKNV